MSDDKSGYFHYYYNIDLNQDETIKEEELNQLDLRLYKQFKEHFNPEISKKRLLVALKYSGKSRDQIKSETEVSTSMISNYLNAPTIIPSFNTLKKLAIYLDVSYSWLIGVEDADIEGLNYHELLPHSNIVKMRRQKLASMLTIHFHLPEENVSTLYNLVRQMEHMNRLQLNQMATFAKGVGRSELLPLKARNIGKVLYTEYPEENSDKIPEKYDDLILLNEVTEKFNPIISSVSDRKIITEDSVKQLLNALSKVRDNPEVLAELDLFTESINQKVFYQELQAERIERIKKRLLDRSNKKSSLR